MPSVITDLCLRDGACLTVCPVDCIVPGEPSEEWSHYYIDPVSCIDCGACIPECPHGAIYPLLETPEQFKAGGGEFLNRPTLNDETVQVYSAIDHNGMEICIPSVRKLNPGEVVDLTNAIQQNDDFFEHGPGYSAR